MGTVICMRNQREQGSVVAFVSRAKYRVGRRWAVGLCIYFGKRPAHNILLYYRRGVQYTYVYIYIYTLDMMINTR